MLAWPVWGAHLFDESIFYEPLSSPLWAPQIGHLYILEIIRKKWENSKKSILSFQGAHNKVFRLWFKLKAITYKLKPQWPMPYHFNFFLQYVCRWDISLAFHSVLTVGYSSIFWKKEKKTTVWTKTHPFENQSTWEPVILININQYQSAPRHVHRYLLFLCRFLAIFLCATLRH